MIMSEGDIVLEYRQAKDPKAQIRILMDENACTRKEITDILKKHGLELPGPTGKRPKQEAQPQLPELQELPELPEIPEDIAEDTKDLSLYYHAVQAIARLLDIADADEAMAISFKEQVRGVMAMTYECGG